MEMHLINAAAPGIELDQLGGMAVGVAGGAAHLIRHLHRLRAAREARELVHCSPQGARDAPGRAFSSICCDCECADGTTRGRFGGGTRTASRIVERTLAVLALAFDVQAPFV